ncbi:alpha-2 type XI collagen [Haloferula helveola]|uniref:Alpha-2 type XI collagen n=1 Tax=Haloferula helveola TaxID=490095 RepID=A0ABM7RI57_9BACT|nr:alpha-2 type XI collagen [Haloferula helveola]
MAEDPGSLDKLHDIVLPDAVPWWPPAPGWIVLAVVVLAALSLLTRRQLKHRKANAYRRAALAELSNASSCHDIARILRRTALAIAPRETVAGLDGDAWISWLGDQASIEIPAAAGKALTGSVYDASGSEAPPEDLAAFADSWIRNHRRPC